MKPVAEPTSYAAWLDTLPDHIEQASEPFVAGFHGKVEVFVPERDITVEVLSSVVAV
jgi:hypothetical protein